MDRLEWAVEPEMLALETVQPEDVPLQLAPQVRDRFELTLLRLELQRVREERGETCAQVEDRMGGGYCHFIYHQELGRSPSTKLSTLQRWAGAYDLRLEFQLQGFWLYSWDDAEMLSLYTMSRGFDAHSWQRLWLVAALRALRLRQGVSATEMAGRLGVTRRTTVTWWEVSSTDPFVQRVQQQARVLGSQVRLQLWGRDGWRFG